MVTGKCTHTGHTHRGTHTAALLVWVQRPNSTKVDWEVSIRKRVIPPGTGANVPFFFFFFFQTYLSLPHFCSFLKSSKDQNSDLMSLQNLMDTGGESCSCRRNPKQLLTHSEMAFHSSGPWCPSPPCLRVPQKALKHTCWPHPHCLVPNNLHRFPRDPEVAKPRTKL